MSKDLSKHYGKVTALENLSLELNDENKIVGLIGPNGSGKSTLLRIAYGLLKPSSGELKVLSFDSWKDQVVLRKNVGYVSESSLSLDIYVKDVLSLFFNNKNSYDVFHELGLHDLSNKRIKDLSAGQKQVLKIGIVFSQAYKVILMDEPFKDLDYDRISTVMKWIRKLSNENIKFIISSHVLGVMEELIDYLIVLDHGRLVLNNKKEKLLPYRYIIECSDTEIIYKGLEKLGIKAWIEEDKIIVYFKDELEELTKLLSTNDLIKYVESIGKYRLSTLYKEVTKK
ncbi:MAG: ATP-binding cassette domain-containing protein [Thermoprotei archaeon]